MAISDEEFDWDAYHRDTRELSLAAKGAWWDCLYKMRLSVTRGRISMPIEGYARMFGSTVDHAKNVLNEISEFRVGDAVTERNGKITVTNRRMFRAFQEREANNNRQARHREKLKLAENAERNGIVTNDIKTPSSSEGDISIKKEVKQKKNRTLVSSSRIPNPFPITEEMAAWVKEKHPGLCLEDAHASFIRYYTNLTTAKAFKVDWYQTWQNGMDKAMQWQLENQAKALVGRSDDLGPAAAPLAPCQFCGNPMCLKNHDEERRAA